MNEPCCNRLEGSWLLYARFRVHPCKQVFCIEQPWDNGFYRSFLAASYQRLWPRLNQQPAHERHYYEVLSKPWACFGVLVVPSNTGLYMQQSVLECF